MEWDTVSISSNKNLKEKYKVIFIKDMVYTKSCHKDRIHVNKNWVGKKIIVNLQRFCIYKKSIIHQSLDAIISSLEAFLSGGEYFLRFKLIRTLAWAH